MSKLEENNERLWDRKTFIYAMIASMIWGMMHLYRFTRLMVSHDSLAEFYADARLALGYTGVQWKISLGRFVVPVYQKLVRSTVTVPWLIGVLSVLFLGLTIYFIARIFQIRRGLTIFLAAGIIVVNPAIFTTAAAFIHDLDCDMLALLLSTVAVWCWVEDRPVFLGLGALCVSMSMGIYASYLSVTVVLVIFVSIRALLGQESPTRVVMKGLKAIVMIVFGLALYACMTQIVCHVTGIALDSNSYNSVANALNERTRSNLAANVLRGYQDVYRTLFHELFGHGTSMNLLAMLTLGGGLILLIAEIFRRKISLISAVLILVLLVLLPIGMNAAMIANNGQAHDLMKYAFTLVYLLVLLLAERGLYTGRGVYRAACVLFAACIALVSWQHTVQANEIYLKKELESRFTASTMTRIMTQVEQREDYVYGETPLMFAGDLNWQIKSRPELVRYWDYTGVDSSTPIQNWKLYEPYLEYLMGIEVVYVDGQTRWDMVTSQAVHDMPVYPEKGSIQMIDGVLVIKVGPVNETK